jgi:hypothetical protein
MLEIWALRPNCRSPPGVCVSVVGVSWEGCGRRRVATGGQRTHYNHGRLHVGDVAVGWRQGKRRGVDWRRRGVSRYLSAASSSATTQKRTGAGRCGEFLRADGCTSRARAGANVQTKRQGWMQRSDGAADAEAKAEEGPASPTVSPTVSPSLSARHGPAGDGSAQTRQTCPGLGAVPCILPPFPACLVGRPASLTGSAPSLQEPAVARQSILSPPLPPLVLPSLVAEFPSHPHLPRTTTRLSFRHFIAHRSSLVILHLNLPHLSHPPSLPVASPPATSLAVALVTLNSLVACSTVC